MWTRGDEVGSNPVVVAVVVVVVVVVIGDKAPPAARDSNEVARS